MKKIEMLKNKVKSMREEAGQEGFSLIELVVAVGILAILSVVGVIAYSQITDNARQQALNAAAAEVYTAAVAFDSDGNDQTDPMTVDTEWMATADNDSIEVEVAKNGSGQIVVKAVNGKSDPAFKGPEASTATFTI